jgi:phosphocarrier protein
MQEFSFTITDPLGMHARPVGLFIKEVTSYESNISMSKGEKDVDAKGVFSVMGLAVKNGDTVTIRIEGSDEVKAAQKLEAFMKKTF